ncbi:hypothetical protein ABC977_12755 [Thioalkalicoccus limnaeus]|uniref:Lipoprotein n=1 Tax=Thioalkalicoccus limnaeus TaxID=120681 RepID=A0ABV4BIX8_9GAMM
MISIENLCLARGSTALGRWLLTGLAVAAVGMAGCGSAPSRDDQDAGGPAATESIKQRAPETRPADRDTEPGRVVRPTQLYAMAYFPTRGATAPVATASDPGRLHREGIAGYGVYTFVLFGAAFPALAESELRRYQELLRVIEGYILAPDQGAPDLNRSAHVFLVPAEPRRSSPSSSLATGAELAATMRRDVVSHLRHSGQPTLAELIQDRPGPFLVSSLEPRLVPGRSDHPRLIVDLSGVGIEQLYPIVDAYDRLIDGDQQGQASSLMAISERLAALSAVDTRVAAPKNWIHWMRPATDIASADDVPRPGPTALSATPPTPP